MPETKLIEKLQRLATECRLDIIEMISKAGSGHPGSSLSAIDILVALYFHEMHFDPKNPYWEDRDRFILSKGHAVPALYSVLVRSGCIGQEELGTLRQINSRLQGHPDRIALPFIEASTGSLGQGLSIAQGMALGLKLQKKEQKVFCLIGDGECQEGQIWETAMSAPKYGLNNLIVFLDNNNGQIDGTVKEIMDISPIDEKWRAFRWATTSIDGHNFSEILAALEQARKEEDRPTIIIARTIKGKGVSFMENQIKWHGTAPNEEETKKALSELRARL
ncbi:MAG: transketolase [Deltaproteobacteria bacterium]|nr:transketolase [Deltaproteobacteria bacterium]